MMRCCVLLVNKQLAMLSSYLFASTTSMYLYISRLFILSSFLSNQVILAREIASAGYYLSLPSAIVQEKKGKLFRDTVEAVPLDRLLTETGMCNVWCWMCGLSVIV